MKSFIAPKGLGKCLCMCVSVPRNAIYGGGRNIGNHAPYGRGETGSLASMPYGGEIRGVSESTPFMAMSRHTIRHTCMWTGKRSFTNHASYGRGRWLCPVEAGTALGPATMSYMCSKIESFKKTLYGQEEGEVFSKDALCGFEMEKCELSHLVWL